MATENIPQIDKLIKDFEIKFRKTIKEAKKATDNEIARLNKILNREAEK